MSICQFQQEYEYHITKLEYNTELQQQLGTIISTMQKKNIDNIIGIEDYNKKIFDKSLELISSCKKIPINQLTHLHRNENVKKKYNAIQDKLQNILKILRNFTQAQKPTFNNPMDLATQILEQTKLKVQIKFRKANQQKNTVKVVKNQMKSKKQRPQQMYNIKPYQNFDLHYHQNYLQNGKIPQLEVCNQIQKSLEFDNQYAYVDTPQKLQLAINQLKHSKQIAVDLEHSNKSYQGFTCLIQISTRTKDYIIDVFPIWSQIPRLSQVISNPNILKVMHGAEMDTQWLQRDFNIDIINLFDTYKASRYVGTERFSYAHLLNQYCGISTDKKYQLSDWRIRPLSAQMLKYARTDTHYLLQIYDNLRVNIQYKVNSMHLNIKDTFYDIQKSSHDVTLTNVQLFSYRIKEIYIKLQEQFQQKKQEFKAIQSIFEQINYCALKQDENFDDLILKKDLYQCMSFIKDIVFNRKSKVSKQARIQKIATILQRSNNPLLVQPIANIKRTLLNIFCKKMQGQNLEKSKQKNIVVQLQSMNIQNSTQKIEKQFTDIQYQKFSRQKNTMLKFQQLDRISFGYPINQMNKTKLNNKKKNIVNFGPLIKYLSNKYGVEQMKQQSQAYNNQSQQSKQVQQANNQEEMVQENQEQGVIQFKRMNPNVIYTIQPQQADEEIKRLENSQKPRKMRKETEYQERIRNKKGNLFDLLGDS